MESLDYEDIDEFGAIDEDDEPSRLTDSQATAVLRNPRFVVTTREWGICIKLVFGGKIVGTLFANLEDEDLRDEYREQVPLFPVYVASDVYLDIKLRGHGLGKKMYLKAIDAIARNGGGSFGPHYVIDRKDTETSDAAMRVWYSLCREYKKFGPFIVVGKGESR